MSLYRKVSVSCFFTVVHNPGVFWTFQTSVMKIFLAKIDIRKISSQSLREKWSYSVFF